VEQWLREIRELNTHNPLFLELTPISNHIVEMIDSDPGHRPSAETVASWFVPSTPCCTNATSPDPFSIEMTIEEDAEDEDKVKSIYEQDIETLHKPYFNEGEEWVSRAFGLIPNILKKNSMAGGNTRLSEVLDDLILRCKDWKDSGIENSGTLLLHGTFEIPEEKRPTDRKAKTSVSQVHSSFISV